MLKGMSVLHGALVLNEVVVVKGVIVPQGTLEVTSVRVHDRMPVLMVMAVPDGALVFRGVLGMLRVVLDWSYLVRACYDGLTSQRPPLTARRLPRDMAMLGPAARGPALGARLQRQVFCWSGTKALLG